VTIIERKALDLNNQNQINMNSFRSKPGLMLLLTLFCISPTLLAVSHTNLSGLVLTQKTVWKTTQQAPLSKEKVRHYIKTRILEFKLQKKMKAQTKQYENVIQEFYKKRKTLLQDQGWTVEEFEATQSRIFAVQNAMKTQASMTSEVYFKKEIAEVKSNNYLTETQKDKTIELMQLDRNNTIENGINPTKMDWSAVQAYRKELVHLVDYCSENRSDAPVLE